jgi:hypothetical protein
MMDYGKKAVNKVKEYCNIKLELFMMVIGFMIRQRETGKWFMLIRMSMRDRYNNFIKKK